MKINVNIEEELEELWDEMGLNPEEVEEQWNLLSQKIEDLIQNFLKDTHDRVQSLRTEAEDIEESIYERMKHFKLGDDSGIDTEAPLIKRIDIAKKRLNNLVEATADQKEDFDRCFEELSNCFDLLEIDERGEFQEKGDDYGVERIEKMSEKTTILQTKIIENKAEIEDLSNQLIDLHDILGMEPFVKPRTCGEPTIESLNLEIEELNSKYDTNYEDITTVLKEVRRLESLLNEKVTSSKVQYYSDDVTKSLHERLDYLNKEKEERLVDYVEALKKELLRLWGELHLETPTKIEFPFFYSKRPSKRTLIALESESLRLEMLKENIEPLINLIAQREEIIESYEEIINNDNKAELYKSRHSSAASTIAHEGRIRRRYEIELPKIHSQMVPMLEDYQETYGEPLLWDGKNLLEEVNMMREREPKRSRRQMSMTRTRTRVHDLNNRAPFQLQGYMN